MKKAIVLLLSLFMLIAVVLIAIAGGVTTTIVQQNQQEELDEGMMAIPITFDGTITKERDEDDKLVKKVTLNIKGDGLNLSGLKSTVHDGKFTVRKADEAGSLDAPAKVWNFLRAHGYSEESTAGIMGNLQQEHNFLTTDVPQGLGICQWIGGRRIGLMEYAASKGKPVTDLQIQLEWLDKEMDTQLMDVRGYKYRKNSFKKIKDVKEATMAFCYQFERPGGSGMEMIHKRINYAKDWFSAYHGKDVVTGEINITGVFKDDGTVEITGTIDGVPVVGTGTLTGDTFSGSGYWGEGGNGMMGDFISPFKGQPITITSGYGWRIHPIFHERIHHDGWDLCQPNDYGPIYASKGGTIEVAGWYGGYGKCVVIDHGGGIKTLYGHLSSIGVRSGQQVTTGQKIGNQGSTGNSTGPHLHWAFIVNGSYADAEQYAKNVLVTARNWNEWKDSKAD